MTYRLEPEMMYMMPIHFGPGMGPRQGPQRRTFECKDSPKTTSVSVSFLTNGEQLETLLPEGFELGAEPVAASYTHLPLPTTPCVYLFVASRRLQKTSGKSHYL